MVRVEFELPFIYKLTIPRTRDLRLDGDVKNSHRPEPIRATLRLWD